ncbi:hypothetical protein F5878DRAFT_668216 [Lentinula raphanica]|uniref:Uncharacterized protein n=1 Tax=Lentinula raphanica TaxID=153919 RepID=A0AA38U1W3_9AGAR|nr:hypothetical protein F5878DRAFT_668216 [Lentinula raphanica]
MSPGFGGIIYIAFEYVMLAVVTRLSAGSADQVSGAHIISQPDPGPDPTRTTRVPHYNQ